MENIIIQKSAMKFTVEVVVKNDELCFNVVRYIEVGKDESYDTNAKLAKHDALQVGGHYFNCNKLIKGALDGMEAKMLPCSMSLKKESKIRLKKSNTFGY